MIGGCPYFRKPPFLDIRHFGHSGLLFRMLFFSSLPFRMLFCGLSKRQIDVFLRSSETWNISYKQNGIWNIMLYYVVSCHIMLYTMYIHSCIIGENTPALPTKKRTDRTWTSCWAVCCRAAALVLAIRFWSIAAWNGWGYHWSFWVSKFQLTHDSKNVSNVNRKSNGATPRKITSHR